MASKMVPEDNSNVVEMQKAIRKDQLTKFCKQIDEVYVSFEQLLNDMKEKIKQEVPVVMKMAENPGFEEQSFVRSSYLAITGFIAELTKKIEGTKKIRDTDIQNLIKYYNEPSMEFPEFFKKSGKIVNVNRVFFSNVVMMTTLQYRMCKEKVESAADWFKFTKEDNTPFQPPSPGNQNGDGPSAPTNGD